MSQDNTDLASAISFADSAGNADNAELVALPATMFNALLTEVHRLSAVVREHEARLDKQSEYIAELRFQEEPEPTPNLRDRMEVLTALLTLNQGKMLAKDARTRMKLDKATFSRLLAKMQDSIEVRPLRTNRRNNLLVLRSAKG
jgi:hypothetical protein